ncbi:hypothetical protein LINPERPRIM_LOCUS15940 [Linum perenne]
MIIMMIMTK